MTKVGLKETRNTRLESLSDPKSAYVRKTIAKPGVGLICVAGSNVTAQTSGELNWRRGIHRCSVQALYEAVAFRMLLSWRAFRR